MQILVEILDQGRGDIVANLAVVPPHQPLNLAEVVRLAGAQHVQQFLDRDRALAIADEIDRNFAQRPFRQRGRMAADDDDALLGIECLDGKASRGRRRHLLGRCGRLVPEDDHADQARRAGRDHFRDHVDADIVGLGVDDFHAVAAVAHVAGDEPAP